MVWLNLEPKIAKSGSCMVPYLPNTQSNGTAKSLADALAVCEKGALLGPTSITSRLVICATRCFVLVRRRPARQLMKCH